MVLRRLSQNLLSRFSNADTRAADSHIGTSVRVVLLGPSGAGKSTFQQSLYETWSSSSPPIDGLHLEPQKIFVQPDTGYPHSTHDEAIRSGGRLTVDGKRLPLEFIDTKGGLLGGAETGEFDGVSGFVEGPLYAHAMAADLLILFVPPELLGDQDRRSEVFTQMANYVEKLVGNNPRAMVSICFTKCDEYGIEGEVEARLINTRPSARDLAAIKKGHWPRWDRFVRTTTVGLPSEERAARQSCLNESRELWNHLLSSIDPRLGAITAYWTTARTPDGAPASPATRGVLQPVLDLQAHLNRVHAGPRLGTGSIAVACGLAAALVVCGQAGKRYAQDVTQAATSVKGNEASLNYAPPIWPWPDRLGNTLVQADFLSQVLCSIDPAHQRDPLHVGERPALKRTSLSQQCRNGFAGIADSWSKVKLALQDKSPADLAKGLDQLHAEAVATPFEPAFDCESLLRRTITGQLKGEKDLTSVVNLLAEAIRQVESGGVNLVELNPFDLASTLEQWVPGSNVSEIIRLKVPQEETELNLTVQTLGLEGATVVKKCRPGEAIQLSTNHRVVSVSTRNDKGEIVIGRPEPVHSSMRNANVHVVALIEDCSRAKRRLHFVQVDTGEPLEPTLDAELRIACRALDVATDTTLFKLAGKSGSL